MTSTTRGVLLAAALLFCGADGIQGAEQGGALPNLVVLLADDLGYGDLACYGGKTIRTPNLDTLAREGMRFTSFYVAQPVCSASRAALLTGCYPNRIGIHGALGPSARHGISTNEVTLAELVRGRGYATAIYGKWHLGHQPVFLPTRHGFDEYFGLPYSNDMWPRHPGAKPGTYPDLPLIEGEEVVQTNPDQSQLTRWYTDRAVSFIERNRSRPFFIYVPYAMPHVPLFASKRFQGRSRAGVYGDAVAEIDSSVGEIMRALGRCKVDDRTWVVFLSDNGPWLSYGTHAGSAGRLREGKGTVWEGGIRVPCVMRWPGRIPAGQVAHEPLMTIDLLPTVARLIGAPLPGHPIDGLDVWPVISGEPGARTPHEAYFLYYGTGELQAVRSGRWKLMLPHRYVTLNGRPGGVKGQPVPLDEASTGLALYDLETDVGEKTNVVGRFPDVVDHLQGLVERMRDELGDSLVQRTGTGVRAPGLAPVSEETPP